MKDLIAGDNPFSDEAIELILNHNEEDTFVDYKECFDPKSEKHWLGITIDAIAFANTYGGYLVIGIEDKTWELKGIPKQIAQEIADVNLIHQKLNRYVSPSFKLIRSKIINKYDLFFVIIYIPESKGETHIIMKEGTFLYPTKKEKKILLRPGTTYIRRSGGNSILDSEAIEFIVEKRLNIYKTSLLDNIAKVVEAPVGHEIRIFDPTNNNNETKKFVISDSPDAIPYKGTSFTTPPATDEQEIASFIALAQKDRCFIPPEKELWRLYSKRHQLKLSDSQLASMTEFSLFYAIPSFYWMKSLNAEIIKNSFLKVINHYDYSVYNIGLLVKMSAFIGENFYQKIIHKLGKSASRISCKPIPEIGPRGLFSENLINSLRDRKSKEKESDFKNKLEKNITEYAIEFSNNKNNVVYKMSSQAIDCYLYARDDKYRKRKL